MTTAALDRPMDLRRLLAPVGVGAVMFGLAYASMFYTRAAGHIAVVWPANAVLLAALLSVDTRRWPAILFGAYCGLMAALYGVAGLSYWPAPAMALFNAGESLICAVAIRRLLGRQVDLVRARDLIVFVVMGGLIAPLVSAVPASLLLSYVKHGPLLRYLVEWIGSTGLGLLILTPAMISLTPQALAQLFGRERRWRALWLFAALGGCLALAFLQNRFSLLFLLMPLLMAITFLLEQVGGALAMLITAAVAVVISIAGGHGASPAGVGLISQLLEIQFFLAVAVVSVLAAAAVLVRQRRLTTSLQEALNETEAARGRALQHQRWSSMAEEMAHVGHWRFDVVTGDTVWSDEIFRIFGVDRAAGIPDLNENLRLYHPDDRAEVAANFLRARRRGESFIAEVRIVRPDGQVRHVLSRGVAERDAEGEVHALFGAFMDITEAKQVEQVLRESEERYRMLAERATDIILRYDRTGVIEFASPAVNQLGYEPQELVGRSMAEFVHPEDQAPAFKGRQKAVDGTLDPDADRPDVRVRRADGAWIWVQGSPSPIRNDAGDIVGVVTVLRDVSVRRAMEDELRRKKGEAEQAAVAKSEFMANMSHEIRTPLTAIIGFSALLQRQDGLPDMARRHVQRIVAGGQALLDVVNDILDFSKLEASQVELDPHPFDPSVLIDEGIALVAGQAAAKGLEMTWTWSGAAPVCLVADGARIKQVLLNLLTNAVKFTDQGSVHVVASYREAEAALRIAVHDTGCGIPGDKRDRLFERFSQVDNSISRRHGGTGLGLAICKSLTDLMGGRIKAQSTENAGSIFTFWTPAAVGHVGASAAGAEGEVVLQSVEAATAILVVDDREENRELIRSMLETIGHGVEAASSGAQAVALAAGRRFDLILMDLQMPGMDGFAATRAIRAGAENGATPIVALSANVLAEHVAQCLEAGMNDHVAKPVRLDDLAAKVAQWIGDRCLTQAAQ